MKVECPKCKRGLVSLYYYNYELNAGKHVTKIPNIRYCYRCDCYYGVKVLIESKKIGGKQ